MSLELVVGGMFSGKTSEMIRRLKRFQVIGKKILVVNSAKDTRNPLSVLQTHDKTTFNCVKTDSLEAIQFGDVDVVAIDEAQFFTGLRPFVERALGEDLHILVAGLDGDFRQKTFGEILTLVPLADDVTKLKALCMVCMDGTPGPFSKRLTSDEHQELVGDTCYMATCRKHLTTKLRTDFSDILGLTSKA